MLIWPFACITCPCLWLTRARLVAPGRHQEAVFHVRAPAVRLPRDARRDALRAEPDQGAGERVHGHFVLAGGVARIKILNCMCFLNNAPFLITP